MSATKIMPCECKHEYQSLKYGMGMRVHNVGPVGKSGNASATCTVCGKKKAISGAAAKSDT